jgi:hypothetical protein
MLLRLRSYIRLDAQGQVQGLARYKGKIESPWDEIAIHYILVVHNISKSRAVEAFKEQCALVSLVLDGLGKIRVGVDVRTACSIGISSLIVDGRFLRCLPS